MTKRQSDFCTYYTETRNASESCKRAGYSDSYCKSKSHLLLKNEEILEQVTYLTDKHFKEHFSKLALIALKGLEDVINDGENRSTQLRASMYVLNATGLTPEPAEREKVKTVFEVLIPPEYAEYGIL